MRRFFPILFLVAFLVAPLAAKEEPKPSELFAEKEEKFLRAIAGNYVKAGDALRKENLFQYARMLYEEAIKYYEHDKDARSHLGYVRKGRDWVQEPGEGIPNTNTRPQNVSEQLFKERAQTRFEQEKEKADRYAAAKYASLGTWCEKEGLADQAKKAWGRAVLLDGDNEVARTGLGYRKVDGKWLTEKQLKAIEEAKEGRLVNDTPSRFEAPMGITLNKMESGHFRIETVFPAETLKDYVKNCETAYAYFLRDVGEEEIKDIWGRKALLLVLSGKEQWHRWVDLFGSGGEKQKEFTKQCKGSRGDPNLFGVQYEGEEDDHTGTVDGLVHKVAHMLVYHYFNITDQAWLQEGFAYYYTVKVLESTKSHCVALGSYNNPGGGMKDWGQSDAWKELVKKDVAGHADPDLRMFYAQQTQDLQYNASVKAWSMISWLFDKHREKFMQWLHAVGREGQSQEEAFKAVFGWQFEEVDKAWREWVLENY